MKFIRLYIGIAFILLCVLAMTGCFKKTYVAPEPIPNFLSLNLGNEWIYDAFDIKNNNKDTTFTGRSVWLVYDAGQSPEIKADSFFSIGHYENMTYLTEKFTRQKNFNNNYLETILHHIGFNTGSLSDSCNLVWGDTRVTKFKSATDSLSCKTYAGQPVISVPLSKLYCKVVEEKDSVFTTGTVNDLTTWYSSSIGRSQMHYVVTTNGVITTNRLYKLRSYTLY